MTEPHQSDPVNIYVGTRLRAARREAGLSQIEAAELCCVSYQQMQKYETGFNRISCSRLVKLSVRLNKKIEWFFEGCPGYSDEGPDESLVGPFFSLPYAKDVAENYIAIAHNVDRSVVDQVARALARKNV